jgi:hypothetical protein
MASGTRNYFRHYLYIIRDGADGYAGSYSGSIKVGITNITKDWR